MKDLGHQCLRRPADTHKLHTRQQKSRERGVQRGMELPKRYPTAFSCVAAVMERVTVSSVAAHCQLAFEMEDCDYIFTGLEGGT